MVLTLEEVKQRLANKLDEISLIEVLGVTAEDIVEAFEDRIDEDLAKYAAIAIELQEEDED